MDIMVGGHNLLLVLVIVLVGGGGGVSALEPLVGDEVLGNEFFQEISSEVESLKMERASLLEEIDQLREEREELTSNTRELERSVAERSYENTTAMRPADCADLLMSGTTKSGVYDIYPFSCICGSPIRVYCDMETDGGGWTLILNREDQKDQLNFNRTWNDYKTGFGSPQNEFWLGNENIHMLTTSRSYSLRMDLNTLTNGNQHIAYETFSIQNEINRYKLMLGSRLPDSTISNDCFYYNKNRYFSTYDRDNDYYSNKNCASTGGGGFWYYKCYIRYPPTGVFDNSMNNTCYTSTTYQQVSNLQMKVRPTICDSPHKRINLLGHGCTSNCNAPAA